MPADFATATIAAGEIAGAGAIKVAKILSC
jgi:hypothetical protein